MVKANIFNIQKFSIHDGPGIRTSIFFKGCNLKCAWCANPESQSIEKEVFCEPSGDRTYGRLYTVDELMVEIVKDKAFYDKSGGGVTLTGGEPFLQNEFIILLCQELKNENINVAAETAGYIEKSIFKQLAGLMDYIFVDFKHYNPQKHINGTGLSNSLIVENIKWLSENHRNFVVRIPVIPGFNDSLADAEKFALALNEMKVKQVELLPFHQLGEKKYELANRDYSYKGISGLYPEDLSEYRKILTEAGVNII